MIQWSEVNISYAHEPINAIGNHTVLTVAYICINTFMMKVNQTIEIILIYKRREWQFKVKNYFNKSDILHGRNNQSPMYHQKAINLH